VTPRLLDLHAAGKILSMSYSRVYALVKSGALPIVVVPGRRRIYVDVLDLNKAIENWKERADA
jgi:predicted DNA-binding transcriptional regulator AlpA